MAVVYLNLVNIFIPVSYLMGSSKWVKNVGAKDVKLSKEARGNSMYHFAVVPVSVF